MLYDPFNFVCFTVPNIILLLFRFWELLNCWVLLECWWSKPSYLMGGTFKDRLWCQSKIDLKKIMENLEKKLESYTSWCYKNWVQQTWSHSNIVSESEQHRGRSSDALSYSLIQMWHTEGHSNHWILPICWNKNIKQNPLHFKKASNLHFKVYRYGWIFHTFLQF